MEEGLSVDLTIPAFGSKVPSIYRAALPTLGQSTVERFLTAIGDTPGEVIADECYDGVHSISMRTGKQADVQYYTPESEGALGVYSFGYTTQTYLDYTYAFMNYGGVMDGIADNTDLYREPKEFSFASSQEAVQQAEAVLDYLGIQNAILAEKLYLDHETMTDYVRSSEAAETIAVYGAEALAERGYDSTYDAYVLRFAIEKDGIFTSTRLYQLPTTTIAPTTIEFMINASGVVNVSISFPWVFAETLEVPAGIISAEDILQIVEDFELEVVSESPRTIDGISLEYISVQDGDHWNLKPVWVVTVLYKGRTKISESECFDEHQVYCFDAMSGKQIA